MSRVKIPDIELGQYKKGYPALASKVVEDVDDEPLVCRKFRYLGAQNLFHMQGELYELEDRLKRCNDELSKTEALADWRTIHQHEAARAAVPGSSGHKRVLLIEEVRGKLREYCKQSLPFC